MSLPLSPYDLGPQDELFDNGPEVCGSCGSRLYNVSQGSGICPTCKEGVPAVSQEDYEDSLSTILFTLEDEMDAEEEEERKFRGLLAEGVAQGVGK